MPRKYPVRIKYCTSKERIAIKALPQGFFKTAIVWLDKCEMTHVQLDVEHSWSTRKLCQLDYNWNWIKMKLMLILNWNNRSTTIAYRDFDRTFCAPITRHSTSALSSVTSSTSLTAKIPPSIGTGNGLTMPEPIESFYKKVRPTYIKFFIGMKNDCPTF